MPDITMCPGTDCPQKERCYRFTAKPCDYQSWFVKAPIKDGKCEYYWGENAESIWNQLKEIVEIPDPTPPRSKVVENKTKQNDITNTRTKNRDSKTLQAKDH